MLPCRSGFHVYKLRLDFTKFSADIYCKFGGSHLLLLVPFFWDMKFMQLLFILLVCVCIFIYILIEILLVYI